MTSTGTTQQMSGGTRRVFLVTGSASGLGRALTEAALERGGLVVATARTAIELDDVAWRHRDRLVTMPLDVTDSEQAQAAVQAGVDAFGRIDVVVNNAGYGLFGALEELAADELHRQFATNTFGSLNVVRAALPQLRRQRSGHIVQISSLDGIAPLGAGESAYAASKFAVEGACEVLATELQHLGIRVTIVEPGPVRTEFGAGAVAKPVTISDYDESVGKALSWFEQLAGNQPNDPRRVAQAVLDVLDADEPPLRLALGVEAVEGIRAKLERQRRELDAWEHLATATGFGDS